MTDRPATTDPDALGGDLTWPALLAQWMDFARATGRLVPGPENDRWRSAAPAIISLQAVAFALADLGRLPVPARAEALDKARVLIRRDSTTLRNLWSGSPPDELGLLIADAQAAVEAAANPPPPVYPSPRVAD